MRRVAPDGTIATVAGNGGEGFAGDGGRATEAALYYPHAVAVASDGGFLIADASNDRVRRVAQDGTIATVAGSGSRGFSGDGGPATEAQLNNPSGVAVAPDGGFLIAEAGNNRVRRVAPDGTIATVAGSGEGGFAGDGGPATKAGLNYPTAVAVAPDGGFLIADHSNHRVRRVAPDGTIATVAGCGSRGFSGDGGPATEAQLRFPFGVAVAPDGGFLIADASNDRVRRVAPDGTIATVAGSASRGFSGDGGPATEAQLNSPTGIAATPDGGFLISDEHRVLWVSGATAADTVTAGADATAPAAPLATAGVRPEPQPREAKAAVCAECGIEASPARIGGADYCPSCGSRWGTQEVALPQPADTATAAAARAAWVVARIPVGEIATDIGVGLGAVWVAERHERLLRTKRTIKRINPSTSTIAATIPLSKPGGVLYNVPLAVGLGAVWVLDQSKGRLYRIDPATNDIVATIAVHGTAIAVGLGAVWCRGSILHRIDPAMNSVAATVRHDGDGYGYGGVAAGLGGVWVPNQLAGTVSRIDPATNTIAATIAVGGKPLEVAVGFGGVWVSDPEAGTVSRIDPEANAVVATVEAGGKPNGVAVGLGGVWVPNREAGTVSRIDPATNTIVLTVGGGGTPHYLAVGLGSVWVVEQRVYPPLSTVSRLQPPAAV